MRRGGYEFSMVHVVLVVLNSTSIKYPRMPVKPLLFASSGVNEISMVFSSSLARLTGIVETVKSLSNHKRTSFLTLTTTEPTYSSVA